MEELNQLLHGNKMQFKFQPIVSSVDGSIFGYEALIRSDVPGLESPWDIINLATEFSMLNQLETCVQLRLLEIYKESKQQFNGRYLFFNSIPAETISEDVYNEMVEKYSEYLPNIVIEISEREKHSMEVVALKSQFTKDHGGKMAFDNYGAGFNSKESIFAFNPDYIKIDFCIISHLDKNKECEEFLRNFVIEAHEKNVKLIALGIERSSQLELAIKLGVDYLQGFYITHPRSKIIDEVDDNLKNQILEANLQK